MSFDKKTKERMTRDLQDEERLVEENGASITGAINIGFLRAALNGNQSDLETGIQTASCIASSLGVTFGAKQAKGYIEAVKRRYSR